MPDKYPPLPYRWTLDGLPFNAGGTVVARYALEVTGHRGQTGRRSNKRPRTAADGAFLGGVYREPRTIVFRRCRSVFTTAAEEAAERDRLAALFSGSTRLATLTHTHDGRTRLFRGVLDSAIEPEPAGTHSLAYDFTVFCPDSRAFSGNVDGSPIESGPIRLDDGGTSFEGTAWDGPDGAGTRWDGSTGSGLVYDSPPATPSAPGALTIVNEGNAPTSVALRVVAVLNTPAPTILHPDGSMITYNGTLAAGSTWTVDTADGRSTVNGSPAPGSLRNADMFQLQPGSTTLRFTSTSLAADARLWATHYSAHYAG